MNIELKLIRILMALTDGDTNTAKRGIIEILEYLTIKEEEEREMTERAKEVSELFRRRTVDFEAEK